MQQFITDLITLAVQYFDGLFGLGLKGAIAGNARTEAAFAELESTLSAAIHGGYAK